MENNENTIFHLLLPSKLIRGGMGRELPWPQTGTQACPELGRSLLSSQNFLPSLEVTIINTVSTQ